MNKTQGIVSLITTIIVGLLLVIITTGAIAITVSEARQATDGELSTRAYFAAEAGVEDGIIRIKRAIQNHTALPNQNTCVTRPVDSNSRVTCQLITPHSNELTESLKAEQATELDLSGIAFTRLVVSWNQKSDIITPDTDPQITCGTPVPIIFPPINGWDVNTVPAVMEVFLSSYPNGTFDTADVSNHYRQMILKPAINCLPIVPSHDSTSPNSSQPLPAFCNANIANGQYNCQAELINFDNTRNYVFRFKPRYNRANLKVQVFNGATLINDIPTDYVTVDVTARASDVFRRVATKVIIGANTTGSGVNILDYVIFSDEAICKDFRISRINKAQTGANDGCANH